MKARETGNEGISEIMWEWFVSSRAINFAILYMGQ
jgi:hypothetical protein